MSGKQRPNLNLKPSAALDKVNYDSLDKAKLAFISASQKSLSFAQNFGFVPQETLGASANIFTLDLEQFLKFEQKNLFITLISEGLGTADDARPNDLNAQELVQFWHNIGIKTISSLTNDAASAGLQTILISLYLPSSNPEKVFDSSFLTGFTEGILEACKIIGCVWLSGETPQLKNKIFDDKIDIAGSLFALAPPGRQAVDSNKLKAGDKIVFVASSGPHENGFTTLRALAQELPQGYRTKLPNGQEFWQAINAPSKLYTPLIQTLIKENIEITNLENITGHGWLKLMRSSKPLSYVIHNSLPVPPIFTFIEDLRSMGKEEMLKTFNYGVGFAVFVPDQQSAKRTVELAHKMGYEAIEAGQVLPSSTGRKIIAEPFDVQLLDNDFLLQKS